MLALIAGGLAFGVAPAQTQSTSTLSINDASVMEGDSGQVTATFTVTLSPASTQTVRVNFATAPGTATSATGCGMNQAGKLL